MGCTDPLALNFNSLATQNDGSCTYASSNISPTFSASISDSIQETSGLIYWNNFLFTHNDNTDELLYKLNPITGIKIGTVDLGVNNIDWEEISQDVNNIYIGDFGNNNGNRTNLKIYIISKSSIIVNAPVVDSVQFVYSDQLSFISSPNTTNFDCEAFIVGLDSIYLFTKQWSLNGSSYYSLPKTPGTYTANLRGSINVQGLVTGASYNPNNSLIVLSGYNNTLQPFLFLLYDYTGTNFSSGNKRKLGISLPFHQIEGVCSINESTFYVSNEKFVSGPINIPQKIHELNLAPFLTSINPNTISERLVQYVDYTVYPNPANEFIQFKNPFISKVKIINSVGQEVYSNNNYDNKTISTSSLCSGFYSVIIEFSNKIKAYKLIIKH
jgi:hypothetical protein